MESSARENQVLGLKIRGKIRVAVFFLWHFLVVRMVGSGVYTSELGRIGNKLTFFLS